MSREEPRARPHEDFRLEEEIKFWVRLSSELISDSDQLPPQRALAALNSALNRYLTPGSL